jgi:WD40 repeat protein
LRKKKLLWFGIGGGAGVVALVVVLILVLGGGSGKDGGKSGNGGREGGFHTREVDSFNAEIKDFPAALAVSKDGTMVVASGGKGPNRVRIFDVPTKKRIAAFDPTSAGLHEVAISPDKTWLACYKHREEPGDFIELRDLKTGGLVHKLAREKTTQRLESVAFSPRSDLIAAISHGREIVVWECKSGKQIHLWEPSTTWLRCLDFLPDGRLVTTCDDKTMKIWDLSTKTAVKTIKLEGDRPTQLAISPDGKLAASMEYKPPLKKKNIFDVGDTVFVWNLETGQQVSHFRRIDMGSSWRMRFLADNRSIAISPGIDLEFWDAITGTNKLVAQSMKDWENGQKAISAFAVAADGRLFLLREKEGTLQIWEAKD